MTKLKTLKKVSGAIKVLTAWVIIITMLVDAPLSMAAQIQPNDGGFYATAQQEENDLAVASLEARLIYLEESRTGILYELGKYDTLLTQQYAIIEAYYQQLATLQAEEDEDALNYADYQYANAALESAYEERDRIKTNSASLLAQLDLIQDEMNSVAEELEQLNSDDDGIGEPPVSDNNDTEEPPVATQPNLHMVMFEFDNGYIATYDIAMDVEIFSDIEFMQLLDNWNTYGMLPAVEDAGYYAVEAANHARTFAMRSAYENGETETVAAIAVFVEYGTALGAYMPPVPTSNETIENYYGEIDTIEFLGWNTMPDGSGDYFDMYSVVAEDITLFAQWENMLAMYEAIMPLNFAATVMVNNWEDLRDAFYLHPAAAQPGGLHVVVTDSIEMGLFPARGQNALIVDVGRNITLSGQGGEHTILQVPGFGWSGHVSITGGTFTLRDGIILDMQYDGRMMAGLAGVNVSFSSPFVGNIPGTFNMEGGTIQGVPGHQAVSVAGHSTFNMTGGTIQDTRTFYNVNGLLIGNAVGVNIFSGTFNMYYGTIQNNHGPGVTLTSSGVEGHRAIFNMHDGVIQGNRGNSARGHHVGGGVHVLQHGVFEMHGGTIAYNMSAGDIGGAGVNMAGSTSDFIMHGGTIRNNVTGGTGGGVRIGDIRTFTIYGGNIINNSARDGGGIFVANQALLQNATRFRVEAAAVFSGNNAISGMTAPPENRPINIAETASTSIFDHPLNNFDIGHTNMELSALIFEASIVYGNIVGGSTLFDRSYRAFPLQNAPRYVPFVNVTAADRHFAGWQRATLDANDNWVPGGTTYTPAQVAMQTLPTSGIIVFIAQFGTGAPPVPALRVVWSNTENMGIAVYGHSAWASNHFRIERATLPITQGITGIFIEMPLGVNPQWNFASQWVNPPGNVLNSGTASISDILRLPPTTADNVNEPRLGVGHHTLSGVMVSSSVGNTTFPAAFIEIVPRRALTPARPTTSVTHDAITISQPAPAPQAQTLAAHGATVGGTWNMLIPGGWVTQARVMQGTTEIHGWRNVGQGTSVADRTFGSGLLQPSTTYTIQVRHYSNNDNHLTSDVYSFTITTPAPPTNTLTIANSPSGLTVTGNQTASGSRVAGVEVPLVSGSVANMTFMGWWQGANAPSTGTPSGTQFLGLSPTFIMPNAATTLTAL